MTFPARPNRTAFGPDYEDAKPVRNPKQQLGAEVINDVFWQVAGLGMASNRFLLSCTTSGGALTLENQNLAWDPKQDLAPITSLYVGVGHYRFTFDTEYPNRLGDMVTTSFAGVTAIPNTATRRFFHCTWVANVVDVYFSDSAGAAVDVAEFAVIGF
jgi:hypothetical protein